MTLPLLITALGGYYVFNQIQSSLTGAAEETFNELIPLVELELAILRTQQPLSAYLVTGNQEYILHYQKRSQQAEEALQLAMQSPYTNIQNTQIEIVRDIWLESTELARLILSSSQANNAQQATDSLADHQERILQSTQILQGIYSYTLEEIKEEIAFTQQATQTINLSAIIVISLAITLAIVSVILLKLTITRPIKELELGARYFAKGDLNHQIDINQNDELGTLADSLNDMATRLLQSRKHDKQSAHELKLANTELIEESNRHQRTASQMKRFKQAIEEAEDYIIFTNVDGIIEYANPAVSKATGYTTEELLNQNTSILKSGNHDQQFYERLWETILAGKPFRDIFINRKKDGTIFYEEKAITPVIDDEGIRHYVSTGRDITVQMETHEQLHYLAHHDVLTGLGNRIMMLDRLEHLLIKSGRSDTMIGILFLDLDRFKIINDSLGHNTGDMLLKEIADRLSNTARKGDVICRLGGDEFVVIADNIKHIDDIVTLTERIISSISSKIVLENNELYVTTSIGITIYPLDDSQIDGLLKHADTAMYNAKASGRNTYQFYSYDMTEQANVRIELESKLRYAINNNELSLHYQPKIDAESLAVCGLEALLRWKTESGTSYSPADFIPVLEESGLIHEVGLWVFHTACKFLHRLENHGYHGIHISVNLSAKHFANKCLLNDLTTTLDEESVDASLLELEITESVLVDNIAAASSTLQQLNRLGISIAIDDFGTGYSSLSYLKKLPIDTLKIDRSFVKDIETDEEDKAITAAIISLGKNLNINIVAEGVETRQQAEFLSRKGCNQLQGFYYSPALDENELIEWLNQYNKNRSN